MTIDVFEPTEQLNIDVNMLKRTAPSTEHDEFPSSIASERVFSLENVNPSMNVIHRGRTIDGNEGSRNTRDSMRFNCEFDSKENGWIRVRDENMLATRDIFELRELN
jgi:hypothetical protein